MPLKTKRDDELTPDQDHGAHGENSPYEATREVVRRHLSNKDDVITDDDIANAYTGEPVKDIEEDEELVKSREKDLRRSKEEDDDLDKDGDGFDDPENRDIVTDTDVIDS